MFNAEISAGALMVVETKHLAKLMLKKPTKDEWRHAIEVENILQKKTPATAKRQAILIKKRLDLLHPDLLEKIANGDNELTLQTIFASSLLHSRLHLDFMTKVYGDYLRRLEVSINKNAWEKFWDECAVLDPNIDTWSELTKNKLHQVIIKILAQAKYIDTTRAQKLTVPHIRPELRNLVIQHHPDILRGLEFTQ